MIDNSDSLLIDDVEYGYDGGFYGIYDGIIAWKMKDGTIRNRWTGIPGREGMARRTQALIDAGALQ